MSRQLPRSAQIVSSAENTSAHHSQQIDLSTVSRWLAQDIQVWKQSSQLIGFEPVRSLFVTDVVPIHFLMEIIFSITIKYKWLIPRYGTTTLRHSSSVLWSGYRGRIQDEFLETFRHQGVLILSEMLDTAYLQAFLHWENMK